MEQESIYDWLWLLLVFGAGSRKIWKLLEQYETPQKIRQVLQTETDLPFIHEREQRSIRSNNGQSWIITQHRKLPLIEQHYRRIVNLAKRFRIIFIIVRHQFNPFFRTILYQFSDLLICDGTNAAS